MFRVATSTPLTMSTSPRESILQVLRAVRRKSDDVEDLLRDFWGGEIDASEHRLLSGWRGELFGKKLLGFLEGDYSIAIDADSGFPELRPSR